MRGGRARCSDGGRRGVARPSREGAAPGGGAAGEGPRALQPRVSPFLYPRTNVPAGPQAHARASLFPASRCSRIHASPHPSITASLRNPTPGLKILALPRRGAAGAADARGGGAAQPRTQRPPCPQPPRAGDEGAPGGIRLRRAATPQLTVRVGRGAARVGGIRGGDALRGWRCLELSARIGVRIPHSAHLWGTVRAQPGHRVPKEHREAAGGGGGGGVISKKAAYVPGGKGICGCRSIVLHNPEEHPLPSARSHAVGGLW